MNKFTCTKCQKEIESPVAELLEVCNDCSPKGVEMTYKPIPKSI